MDVDNTEEDLEHEGCEGDCWRTWRGLGASGRRLVGAALASAVLAGGLGALAISFLHPGGKIDFFNGPPQLTQNDAAGVVSWQLPDSGFLQNISIQDFPLPLPADAFITPVFKAGEEYGCFRIPSIIRTHRGTLLAFAEGRPKGCDDNAHHDLVLRRSSDLGGSWGPLILAVQGQGLPCSSCQESVSNPVPLEVTRPDAKVILLHFETKNNPTPRSHGVGMQVISYDDGLTWTTPRTIAYPPVQNDGHMVGPGVGLQSEQGRVYFSAYSWAGNFLYYSDNFGGTFKASEVIHRLGECSIAFLVSAADGRILANCRHFAPTRVQVFWSRDGVPGPVQTKTGLADPSCEGSLLNEGGILYLTNLNITDSHHGRAHLTLKTSLDQGQTWSNGILVWTGYAAYSQLVSLGTPGKLGLLFEAGAAGPYDTISYVQVPVGFHVEQM